MSVQIKLTQGQVTTIDAEDLERVSTKSWFAKFDKKLQQFYVHHSYNKDDGTRTTMSLHRFIMGFPVGKVVDHIDGDTLNNRKSNLRVCTHRQNCANQAVIRRRPGTSKYKGVCKAKHRAGYFAQIGIGPRQQQLGYFDTEEAAARAYNEAAVALYGEYARLNPVV